MQEDASAPRDEEERDESAQQQEERDESAQRQEADEEEGGSDIDDSDLVRSLSFLKKI